MEAILIAISAYFLFAVTNLVDKYIVTKAAPPKVYVFIIGGLSGLVLFLIPFGVLEFGGWTITTIALLSGMIRILAIFIMFLGLEQFDASKIIPAVGGALPIFTFFFSSLYAGSINLKLQYLVALILLIGGTVLITMEKDKKLLFKSLFLAVTSAFLYALSFFGSKIVYLSQPFLSGFTIIYIGSFLGGISFLASKEVRENIFKKNSKKEKMSLKKKGLIIGNQALGATGGILQNFSIALAPLAFLPLINALEGFKYLFLLGLSALLSFKYPSFLEEKFTKKVALKKSLAVILLISGLFLLFLN